MHRRQSWLRHGPNCKQNWKDNENGLPHRLLLLGASTGRECRTARRRYCTENRYHLCLPKALRETRWILSGPRGAASRLGINRSTLQFRMKKLLKKGNVPDTTQRDSPIITQCQATVAKSPPHSSGSCHSELSSHVPSTPRGLSEITEHSRLMMLWGGGPVHNVREAMQRT
jgi:hypothetical protein